MKILLNKLINFTIIWTLIWFCNSCKKPEATNSASENESFEMILETSNDRAFLNEEIELFMKDLQFPTDMLFKLETEGAIFNDGLINDVKNSDSYLTVTDKTVMNLGVFASDIAYLSGYNKFQEVILYLESSRKMADYINVSTAFDIKIMDEFKENFADQEATEALINRNISRTTEILRTDNRTQAAILFIAGAYIEALYISSYIINPNNMTGIETGAQANIASMIEVHEDAISRIISLLNYLDSDEMIDELIADFEKLEKSYDQISSIHSEGESMVDMTPIITFAFDVNSIRAKIVSI